MSDKDRFALLLEQHQRILYHVSRLYARTAPQREDLAQEIALQLWRSFPAFDPARKFSTWMYRIALNVAISSLRQDRGAAVSLTDAAELPAADRVSDEAEELYRRVAQLEPLERSLVLLYLEGHSFPEIGEILGITATNASTKLTRIKQAWKGTA
ncbi:MAG: sigma-70 family RNA polymerase sigma factor [Bryobacteraceae bacterium]|nr:sigma-70 family RNA polymerase sigma factor [Bryobacteraceae bacterium]